MNCGRNELRQAEFKDEVSDPRPPKIDLGKRGGGRADNASEILRPGDAAVIRGGKSARGRAQEIFRPRRRAGQKFIRAFLKLSAGVVRCMKNEPGRCGNTCDPALTSNARSCALAELGLTRPPVFSQAARIRTATGQVYECIGYEAHVCRDGRATELAVVQSECAQCGAPFVFRTSRVAPPSQWNKRCQKHKRPGVRAKRRETPEQDRSREAGVFG